MLSCLWMKAPSTPKQRFKMVFQHMNESLSERWRRGKKHIYPVWIKGVEGEMKNNISSLRCGPDAGESVIDRWSGSQIPVRPISFAGLRPYLGSKKEDGKGELKKKKKKEAKKRDRALAQTLVISGTTSIHRLRVVFTHWSCSPASCNFFPSTPRFLPRAIPNRPT